MLYRAELLPETGTSIENGQGGIRTHEGVNPTRFPIVLLKPLGHLSKIHPSVDGAWSAYGEGGIRTHASLSGPTV